MGHDLTTDDGIEAMAKGLVSELKALDEYDAAAAEYEHDGEIDWDDGPVPKFWKAADAFMTGQGWALGEGYGDSTDFVQGDVEICLGWDDPTWRFGLVSFGRPF